MYIEGQRQEYLSIEYCERDILTQHPPSPGSQTGFHFHLTSACPSYNQSTGSLIGNNCHAEENNVRKVKIHSPVFPSEDFPIFAACSFPHPNQLACVSFLR